MNAVSKSSLAEGLPDAFWRKGTICVLSYGEHPDLLARFLTQLDLSGDAGMFQLRIGLNAPSDESVAIARNYERTQPDVMVFHSTVNLFKNPMMRRMFYDPPIETEWTIWFDDDSYVKRGDWLMRLALKIEREPAIDLWGVRYVLFPNEDALSFAASSPYYRGLPWITRSNESGEAAPCFEFATGSFWAAKTKVLRALDWPDRRLVQAGDDFFFGEALRQNGFQ